MPVEVMRGFEEAFGCKVLEGYGLSETSPVASFNHPDRERKPGSIGTPIEGVEMKVVDDDGNEVAQGEVGEIVIRGHNVMKGYWKRPDATAEAIRDGWFHTGDMATVDEDGYFFIVDRKKDMIIRGGYNVYPREIEEVLYEHPAVREAAVVGVPHDELGEEVGAAVALKEGAECSADELRDVRQGAGRRLQVPAPDLVRRRAAQGPDRQDPQARDRGSGRGGAGLTALVGGAGQWSATVPSSGSIGSPSATHCSMPPAIENASYPAARNACAAIAERAPRRHWKTTGRSRSIVGASEASRSIST